MIYKLDLTPQQMKDLGFRYDHQLSNYVYEFPVYKFHSKTILTCKICIEEETKYVMFNVYDINKQLYSSYYNRTYGKSNITKIVDNNIIKELLMLGATEVEE